MKSLRYLAFVAAVSLASCGDDDAPEAPREEVIVEGGVTYRGTQEGFSLSSNDASGFGFTYAHEGWTCSYENSTNLALKRIYTDRGCDGSIEETLFVDCSDPSSCIILDINEQVRHRDLAVLPSVREQLRADHYMGVWRQRTTPQVGPQR